MRTTMTIEDDIFRELKKKAAETGVRVSDVVNRALRDALSKKPQAQVHATFRMVTFGRGQTTVDHTPADFAQVLEKDDRDNVGDG